MLSLAVKIALAGLGADPSGLDRSDPGAGPASPMEVSTLSFRAKRVFFLHFF
jgi:hypothetical protein